MNRAEGRRPGDPTPGPVIAVLGGCGGAGATTLAAVLAAHGGDEDERPVLIDLDPVGGGIDWALGAEGAVGARWSGLHTDGGRLDPDQLAEGLPRWGDVPFLSCDTVSPPSAEAVRSVLTAATAIGPTIVDVGRWASPAQRAALARAATVVLVLLAEVRGLRAASCLRQAVESDVVGTWQLVVRPSSREITADYAADFLGLPLAGEWEFERGLRVAFDRGIDQRRIGRPSTRLARHVLDLALRP